MVMCPDCNYDNKVGALICTNCGADLYDSFLEQVSTRKLTDTTTREFAGDVAPTSNPIVLYISGDNDPLAIERTADHVFGRGDTQIPNTEITVDLSPYGAREMGVSRVHAKLIATDNPPVLIDLDSYNGTFVNGQRLIPNQQHYLRSGDEIRLAKLTLRLYYK